MCARPLFPMIPFAVRPSPACTPASRALVRVGPRARASGGPDSSCSLSCRLNAVYALFELTGLVKTTRQRVSARGAQHCRVTEPLHCPPHLESRPQHRFPDRAGWMLLSAASRLGAACPAGHPSGRCKPFLIRPSPSSSYAAGPYILAQTPTQPLPRSFHDSRFSIHD